MESAGAPEMSDERYIHIRNFGRFQRFQDRRPTWIRLHLELVDNDAFLALTDHQQAVLIAMWIAYAKSVSRDAEGTFKIGRSLPQDTTKLGRRLGRRVRKDTVDSLLSAGFLEETETETVTFGDGSGSLEVRGLDKNLRARAQDPKPAQHKRRRTTAKATLKCPKCRLTFKAQTILDEHLYHSHDGPEPEHWNQLPIDPDPPPPADDDFDLPPPEERKAIAAAIRASLAIGNGAEPDELPWEGEEPPIIQ